VNQRDGTAQPLRLCFRPAATVPESVTDCELEVLARWYGDTAEELAAAYGPYADQTAFVSLERTDTDMVIGFARLLAPGARLAKTLADIAGDPWHVEAARSVSVAGVDPARTWDVATLGVRPGLRDEAAVAAHAVYHAVLFALRVNEARSLVAIVDHRVRRLLAAVGLQCHTLPGTWPAFYMGSSACTPIYAHLAQTLRPFRTSGRLFAPPSGVLVEDA